MTPADGLPAYKDLPIRAGLPRGSSWGVWGERDPFGCLNLLTPERAVRGAGCVRSGRTFNLNLELELPDPPLFGRAAFTHEVLARPSGISSDDMLHSFNTQSSSQWDGFRHVRSGAHGAYGGLPEAEHGVHHWARKGLVGRGVLADVARWRASTGRPLAPNEESEITGDELMGCLAAQGVTVEPGDFLLIRTGWLAWYRTLGAQARAAHASDPAAPGLARAEATAACLWDLHICAVGCDNPAVEALPLAMYRMGAEERGVATASDDPALTAKVFVHINLLAMLGLPLGELFDLDALAADCAESGTYDFLVTSAPLNLLHGVATPPNILAIR